MAEFAEVIKQAKRMCEYFGAVSCTGCPIGTERRCPFALAPEFVTVEQYESIERIVMQWAAEHPEPKRTSWHEAWKQLFPDGQGSPCPAAYGTKYEPEWCGKGGCGRCKDRPIDAKVAKKLGVAVGGEEEQ